MSDSWTILRVLEWTTERFARQGTTGARLEAQVLLAHVLGCDRTGLYTRFDQPLGPEELAAFRGLIQRRLAGEPVAYLVGEQEFWSLPFFVDSGVLIPRPDSETVIEVVRDAVDRSAAVRIADIGTGSGALAITLAREYPQAHVVATDVSQAALDVAARNAARNDVASRVELRLGSLCEPIEADPPFDVVVSNLPYVRTGELAGLSPEVKREPRGALDGGADGLALVRRLISTVGPRIAAGGLLALEHGHDQGATVRALIDGVGGFAEATTRRDLGKRQRVSFARRL